MIEGDIQMGDQQREPAVQKAKAEEDNQPAPNEKRRQGRMGKNEAEDEQAPPSKLEDDLLKGIIFAEVLSPPKARRRK
ncbi:hypothetical protein [Bacillus xiapuensis]|uniref:hypothetical protein n=1 Tax=Bacillus xiapuensis TaxID=2014075 RepID=UPI000C236F71|nr:hypothetical protein [Bacillus xiapuensis]